MNTNKTTLGDFNPDSVWFTSLGAPTGETVSFTQAEDPDTGEMYTPDPSDVSLPSEDWWMLEGTVSENGREWSWDGEGNPTDWRFNTVTRLNATREVVQ
jgi:hypothetical protein